MASHQIYNGGLVIHRCCYCKSNFTEMWELDNHIENHMMMYFKCYICNFKCNSKRNLAKHLDDHLNYSKKL